MFDLLMLSLCDFAYYGMLCLSATSMIFVKKYVCSVCLVSMVV